MHKKILNKQRELIGKEFDTKSCGKCFIIDYKSNREVTVLFHEPLFAVVCRMDHLRNGFVYNPYARLTGGVGYIGVGKYSLNSSHYTVHRIAFTGEGSYIIND